MKKIPHQENYLRIFGDHLIDEQTKAQLTRCVGSDAIGVLTADAHFGYGHPIGGAIAYKDKLSLSGVGFDIGCGNKAVRTPLLAREVDIPRVMDQIVRDIGFGVGRPNPKPIDHPVFEELDTLEVRMPTESRRKLLKDARLQLGTVGSGNHYVDLFEDEAGYLWIGVHFGSRGFGHKLTMGFIAISQGKPFDAKVQEGPMNSNPILFDAQSEVGQDYHQAVQLAGNYAYAGRDIVIETVCKILGTHFIDEVHNHHNFLWQEEHAGTNYWVVRKGCTPAFPGQQSFIGSTMFDLSYIIEGVEHEDSREALYSTVHGAGRVMSRRAAAGRKRFRNGKLESLGDGLINYSSTLQKAKELGIEIRGGGADESPECYKSLKEVLATQSNSIKILHTLKPVGVAMAEAEVVDPYKD